MSNDLNKCMFIGRLARDPEVRYLPSGAACASFSIAVGSQWKDKQSGDKQERTEWINVTAFNRLGEICGEYLKKGSQVFIEGRFQTDKSEKDGVTKYYTKIIASEMQMLGSPSGKTQQKAEEPQKAKEPQQASMDEFDDDLGIPF